MPKDAVDLTEKLSMFSDHWAPKVVARMNDYEIKVVKVQGEFTWHAHEDTDELFLVIAGELTTGRDAGGRHAYRPTYDDRDRDREAGHVVLRIARGRRERRGKRVLPPRLRAGGRAAAQHTTSVCPRKGVASYYDVHVDEQVIPDGAGAYRHPLPLARRVKGG